MPVRPQVAPETKPFHEYVFDDGTVWTEFFRTGDGYLLRFPDLADFEVSADGTEVVAHPVDGTDAATIEHLYINQLVPLALSRQGHPAFHASAVTMPRGVVAFLGKSGMGKSTLAASFALRDASFLTDDSLIIEENEDGLSEQFLLPFYQNIYPDPRWADFLQRVGSSPEQLAAIEFEFSLH